MRLFSRNTTKVEQPMEQLINQKATTKEPTTVDIFKEYVDKQSLNIQSDRFHKVHQFMQDEGYKKLYSTDYKSRLSDMGFSVIVKASWISIFKYHATVWCGKNKMTPVAVPPKFSDGSYMDIDSDTYYSSNVAQYVGDIPDSVLDKAKKVRDSGLVMGITIHSMQPLPTEFIKCDPILIGWNYCPCIDVDDTGLKRKIMEPNAEGVIIAVWDYDKEFNF